MKLLGQDINPARDSTLNRFRATFFSSVTHQINYPTTEKLLERNREEVEGRGVLQTPDGYIGIVINPSTWLEGFVEQYSGQEWRNYNILSPMLDELDASFNPLIIDGGTYSPRRIKDCMDVMNLWGKEGGTPLLMVVGGKELPLLMRGVGGEVLILGPVLAMDSKGKTKAWYEDQVIRRVKARHAAMEDPDKVWFEDKEENEVILNVSDLTSIHHNHLGYELHHGNDETIIISEETANRLRTEYGLRLYERLRKHKVNNPALKEAFYEAWLEHDPSFSNVDEFNEALAKLIDYMEDNGNLPCSLGFWALHWNEAPPKELNKYRSMYTATEWARAITEIALLGDVQYFKIIPHKDDEQKFTQVALTIHITNVQDDVLKGLDLLVRPSEYKAKHLLKYLSDVQHYREGAGVSPYAWWELTEDLMDFERLYVLPPEIELEKILA
jgi:hypothetical protein